MWTRRKSVSSTQMTVNHLRPSSNKTNVKESSQKRRYIAIICKHFWRPGQTKTSAQLLGNRLSNWLSILSLHCMMRKLITLKVSFVLNAKIEAVRRKGADSLNRNILNNYVTVMDGVKNVSIRSIEKSNNKLTLKQASTYLFYRSLDGWSWSLCFIMKPANGVTD